MAADFPCALTIRIPLPTARLASIAQRALQVDQELSPLVQRRLTLEPASPQFSNKLPAQDEAEKTVLVTHYTATTNRMLRVAVNGFFESVGVVLGCMRELDVDVLENQWLGEGDDVVDELTRVQGLQESGTIG